MASSTSNEKEVVKTTASTSSRGHDEAEVGQVEELSSSSSTADVDAALDFLRHEGPVREMTVEDEKRLVRKIDWMIMPLMWMCYCLQYLDKTLINYANVMGLEEDTNMSKDEYSHLALIFYVSYLAFEFPHAYGMQKLPTARYIGTMVFFWGVIVAVTAACTNYGALVATRVLLGVFESAVAPSLILITSMWYKRNEQPQRVGLWYLGTGTGTIFGSLISYGFQHVNSRTFYSWQIMFLTVGLITCVVGIATFFFLPNTPMSSRLTHEEKVWAVLRLRENQTGIENTHFKPPQMIECFLDPQTWLLCLITIASSVPNGAVSSYQATIIKNFGYDSKTTALLSIPSGAVGIVSILISTQLAGRFNQRGLQVIVLLLIGGVLGGSLMAFLPANDRAGKLIGNYLTNAIGASLPSLYSWVAANYAGHTKKVTMNALLLMSFCLGNILGPLTFTAQSSPQYIPAKVTIIVVCAVSCIFIGVLQTYYVFENRRRDKLEADGGMVYESDVEFKDKTDRENMGFRYRL
ncbi:Thiamine pathway transporter [Sphaerulina musiva]